MSTLIMIEPCYGPGMLPSRSGGRRQRIPSWIICLSTLFTDIRQACNSRPLEISGDRCIRVHKTRMAVGSQVWRFTFLHTPKVPMSAEGRNAARFCASNETALTANRRQAVVLPECPVCGARIAHRYTKFRLPNRTVCIVPLTTLLRADHSAV